MNKKFKLAAFMFGVAFLGSGLAMNNEDTLKNKNSCEITSAGVENKPWAATKSEWEITIDIMMIIGKYFNSNNDYINIMKVNKKYHDLAEMYHFNPIPDIDLFKNMETQYLYNENDTKRPGLYQYVYWYDTNCNTTVQQNDIFKKDQVLNNETKTAVFRLDGALVIPPQATLIRGMNFYRPVPNIIFNQNLKEIGDGVFQCSYIRKLILPKGVLSLGDRCFMFCPSLQEVQTPTTLTSIGNYCFAECSSLEDVTILGNPRIGRRIFIGSGKLEEVKVTDDFKQHQSVFSSRNKTRQVKVIDMNDNSAEDKTEQSEKKYKE